VLFSWLRTIAATFDCVRVNVPADIEGNRAHGCQYEGQKKHDEWYNVSTAALPLNGRNDQRLHG
jgi:hypothetical protein